MRRQTKGVKQTIQVTEHCRERVSDVQGAVTQHYVARAPLKNGSRAGAEPSHTHATQSRASSLLAPSRHTPTHSPDSSLPNHYICGHPTALTNGSISKPCSRGIPSKFTCWPDSVAWNHEHVSKQFWEEFQVGKGHAHQPFGTVSSSPCTISGPARPPIQPTDSHLLQSPPHCCLLREASSVTLAHF